MVGVFAEYFYLEIIVEFPQIIIRIYSINMKPFLFVFCMILQPVYNNYVH